MEGKKMNGRIIRPAEQRLRFPIVGKIKIGDKSERGFPQSHDYFIPSGKYAELFRKAYGDKPSTIQVVFPSDDANEVCREYYEYRDDAGALVARGDGETFEVWSARNGKYEQCSASEHPDIKELVKQRYPSKQDWSVKLTANFILPLVRGIAGLWQFETKGAASSVQNIASTFDMMLAERGFVKGVIFDLNVAFAKSQKPNTKSRYPVVSLVPNESETNLRLIQEAKKPIQIIENQ